MTKIRIHKQFTKCFSKFDSQCQGIILKTIIGIRENTNTAGLRLHKVGEYFSYSVNMNIRILATISNDDILLVYVGNHDETYNWANKNKPVIANDCIVGFVDLTYLAKPEIVETGHSKHSYLAKYGFSNSFITYIDTLDEDSLLDFLLFVAPEYQELILYGENNGIIKPATNSDVIVINNDEELKRALTYSIDAWKTYLHPRQRYIVDYPCWKRLMIKGGPGTGKTVSLVHRFVKEFKAKRRPIFISYNSTTISVVKAMIKSMINVPDNLFVVFEDFKLDTSGQQLKEFLNKTGHVFIDEGQDLSIYFVSRLLALIEDGEIKTPITMAVDLNQSIFNSIGEGIRRLEEHFDTINLDYCYRSTKQIIQKANDYLEESNKFVRGKNFQEEHDIQMSMDETTKRIFCPLNGRAVCSIKCKKANVSNVVRDILLQENIKGNDKTFALICDDDLFGLFSSLGIRDRIFTARNVKGLEFFKGIVVSEALSEPIKTVRQFRRIALKDYVSLTRFRDSLFHIIVEE